jgi:hypothetical protein
MKRKKTIIIHYHYIETQEGESALAEVFDDIFKRIIQKRKDKKVIKNEARY